MGSENKAVDVRKGEELDMAAIDAVLKQAVPGLTGTASVMQYPSGASNLTYAVDYPERRLVLRRPPFGTRPKSGHDMHREYRIMSALKRDISFIILFPKSGGGQRKRLGSYVKVSSKSSLIYIRLTIRRSVSKISDAPKAMLNARLRGGIAALKRRGQMTSINLKMFGNGLLITCPKKRWARQFFMVITA